GLTAWARHHWSAQLEHKAALRSWAVYPRLGGLPPTGIWLADDSTPCHPRGIRADPDALGPDTAVGHLPARHWRSRVQRWLPPKLVLRNSLKPWVCSPTGSTNTIRRQSAKPPKTPCINAGRTYCHSRAVSRGL